MYILVQFRSILADFHRNKQSFPNMNCNWNNWPAYNIQAWNLSTLFVLQNMRCRLECILKCSFLEKYPRNNGDKQKLLHFRLCLGWTIEFLVNSFLPLCYGRFLNKEDTQHALMSWFTLNMWTTILLLLTPYLQYKSYHIYTSII